MLSLDDLKSVIMLSHLTDTMLEKMIKVTLVTEIAAGKYIFREGDYAQHLYSVLEGKVGLELEKTTSEVIMIDKITRGYSFGFSALVDMEQKKYISAAKTLTDVKLLKWSHAELEQLFYDDYEMGFLLMRRIAKIAKARVRVRNVQFLNIYK
jgi:CRP-like cAMP-binding protein